MLKISQLPNRVVRRAWKVILCLIIGTVLWYIEGGARAVSPLFFILALIFVAPFARELGRFLPALEVVDIIRTRRSRRFLRRQHAQKLLDLYINHIRHYPKWLKDSPDYIAPSVAAAVSEDDGTAIDIRGEGFYSFIFTESSDQTRILKIYTRNKLRVEIVCRENTEGHIPYWQAVQITHLNSGTWIEPLLSIRREVNRIIKQKEKTARLT